MIKERDKYNLFWYIVGISALCIKLFLIWYTWWHRHYLVPPGGDPVAHFQVIEQILSGKISFSGYPEGFHLIAAALIKLFDISTWTFLTNLTPVLIILPALAMFFLLRQIFSLKISVLATSVLLLTSNYPLYAFVDGNFPDMLAYGVFAVLLFAFLIRYFMSKNWRNLIYAGIFLVLIVLVHHFTFFSLLAILITFGFLELLFYLWDKPMAFWKKTLIFLGAIIIVLTIGYLAGLRLYGGTVLPTIENLILGKANIDSAANSWNIAPTYNEYYELNGSLVLFFGLAGFLVLLVSGLRRKGDESKWLIIIWLLFFFIASRISAFNYLPRFARELALPLTVMMGFLLEYIFERYPNRNRLGTFLAYGLLGYLMLIYSSLYTGLGKIPDGLGEHVFYWPVDQAKIDWLSQNVPKDRAILYNPSANWYFPLKTTNKIIPFDIKSNSNAETPYIFDDVKVSNMVPSWVPNYEKNKEALESLTSNYHLVKTFDDGAKIFEKN